MELQSGVCGFCSSNSLILKSEYSKNYCNLIYSHFEKELNISSESRTYFDLCPTCVYQITLINSKKNSLVKESDENEEVNDKCALCKQNGEIFKIADRSFLSKCKSWLSNENMVSLCGSCFYTIELDNVLKDHIKQKLSLKDEADHTSPPKLRTILKRRKSTYAVEESSSKESNESELNTLKSKKIKLGEQHNSANTKDSLVSTPVKTKRRRSRNLEKLVDKESRSLENSESLNNDSGNESVNFNLSSISQFVPLSKTDIQIDQKYKLDNKMYNCIPFIKMENFEQPTVQKNESNYVCSLVSQRPMIRVRRTPPIKIKAIKNVKNVQEKKQKQYISKIQQQKLIVKVERMKLDIPIKEETTTSKKKKRVHFNDTPTIIIAEDDYYDDYRNRRKNRKLQEQPDKENVEIIDDASKVEDEKSDSEELITLSLEESDNESNEVDQTQSTEENREEMESEGTSENESKRNEELKEGNKGAKGIEELISSDDDCVIEQSEKSVEDSTEVGKETKENSQNRKDISDASSLENCGDNSKINLEIDKSTKQSTEDGDSSEECVLVECKDSSENNQAVDKNIRQTTEDGDSSDDCELVECENNSKTNMAVGKKTREDRASSDDIVLIECEDNAESSKDKIDDSDDCQNEDNSTIIIDNKNKESDENKKDEISTQDKLCPDENINDHQEKEESTEESVEKSCSRKNSDLEDEKSKDESVEDSIPQSDENTDENPEDEENDPIPETCQVENIENEDEGTEKDSLDGFEVIDQDNGDVYAESMDKISADKEQKEESTDEIDDIESLVKKYCDEEEDETIEKNSVTGEKNEENTVDNGAQSAPEENNSQEETENSDSKQKGEKESEGFGPLIDEVQKCLTSTKDVLDSTKEGTEDQEDDSIPNSLELAEILNSSFDEKSVDVANSSKTETINKNLKRKNTEEEAEVSENKREKIDNSSV